MLAMLWCRCSAARRVIRRVWYAFTQWPSRAWDAALTWLFGDDIFLSYAEADGREYASALASAMAASGYWCVFDRWHSRPGSAIPREVLAALGRSQILVLIGSPGAARAHGVGAEVAHFVKTKRPIIPIIFDDSLSGAIWWPSVSGSRCSTELMAALTTGTPSASTIKRISESFVYQTKSMRLRKTSQLASLFLVAALTAAIGLGRYAAQKTRDAQGAEQYAAQKTRDAQGAEQRLIEATNAAARQQAEAAKATRAAEEQRRTAEEQRALANHERRRARAIAVANSSARALRANPALALRLAVEAVEISATPEAIMALRRALSESRARRVVPVPKTGVLAELVGDERLVVTRAAGHMFAGWDRRLSGGIDHRSAQICGSSFSVSADRDLAYAASVLGGQVSLIDLADARPLHTLGDRQFWDRGSQAVAVAHTRDGTRVRVLEQSGLLRTYAVRTGDQLTSIQVGKTVLKGIFSREADALIVISDSGPAAIWTADHAAGTTELAFSAGVSTFAFSGNGRYVVGHTDQGGLLKWDVGSGVLVGKKAQSFDFVRALAVDETGRRVAVAGLHGAIAARVVDWDSDAAPIDVPGTPPYAPTLVFSPDGNKLLVGRGDNGAALWELEPTRERTVLRGHLDWVMQAIFNRDGSLVATIGADETVRVWDAAAGKGISNAAASMACKSRERIANEADRNMGEVMRVIIPIPMAGQTGIIPSAVIHPRDGTFATGGSDGIIRRWNKQGAILTQADHGDSSAIVGLAYSPSGALLVSGSANGAIRIMESTTFELVAEYFQDRLEEQSVAFCNSEDEVVVAGPGNAVDTLRCASCRPVAQLLDAAKRILSELSPARGEIPPRASNQTARTDTLCPQ